MCHLGELDINIEHMLWDGWLFQSLHNTLGSRNQNNFMFSTLSKEITTKHGNINPHTNIEKKTCFFLNMWGQADPRGLEV